MLLRVKGFDRASMLWIRGKRVGGLTSLLKILTYSGAGKAYLVVAIILNVLQRLGFEFVPRQAVFLRSMLCALIAWGFCSLIKITLNRQRPSEAIAGYEPLVATPACRSFPSAHAASSFAFAMALTLSHHEWASGVAAWAVLVTFSRFYLGVHYPSDLLAGTFLGVLCGFWVLPLAGML